ncbi:uncharacterized protein LOC131685635 [Topomyia yanbarensis]|uniref:uncharacterized protein LOC131685635 n=1 Tax=Topomyia yanbarensis TaxID=2498891 RepID=UPI00273AF38C|nr:uncharacterized protein LOC131685635 [Topomyia yanbarensis]XP_058825480.1 uncharacterized protein LOC131685635 [Topomyia yanbarensis]
MLTAKRGLLNSRFTNNFLSAFKKIHNNKLAKTMDEQPEYVQASLKKIATEQGFTEGRYRIALEPGCNKGDGIMGKLCRALIREEGREQMVVLVKGLPDSELRRQQTMRLYHREVMVYDKLLPALDKFQAEKGTGSGKDDGFFRAPKCYYATCNLEKLEAVVIMEDLRESNFRMLNKFEPVDFPHCRLVMEQLGKLHAVSFAMKDQQPELFAQFRTFNDPMKMLLDMDPKRTIDKVFIETHERASGILTEEDVEAKEAMERLKGNVTDQYVACVNAEDAEPYAVIGHGDCWVNNTMFKYDGKDPTPTDIRLIDWQLCRYVCPILDLSYFLFISTDEKIRAKHFEQLQDTYYNSLSEQLARLGGDVKRQYPRDVYQAQWQKYGRFGMLMGFIVVPMMCTASEDLPDQDEYMRRLETEEHVKYDFGTEANAFERYRKRMAGIIRDVVRLGYL